VDDAQVVSVDDVVAVAAQVVVVLIER
jgi:hypothetical protein